MAYREFHEITVLQVPTMSYSSERVLSNLNNSLSPHEHVNNGAPSAQAGSLPLVPHDAATHMQRAPPPRAPPAAALAAAIPGAATLPGTAILPQCNTVAELLQRFDLPPAAMLSIYTPHL